MPPLVSSNIALDTLTGHNESVDFSDYLNSEYRLDLLPWLYWLL